MSLRMSQQWLWAAIVDGDEGLGAAEAMIEGGQLAPRARLAIYAGGYRLRLLECMRAAYPLLGAALGERLFDAFALDYIHAHPSTSYTLHDLGAGFAGHLAASMPDRAGETDGGAWADFMIALATFERALYAVYDGPGDEDAAASAAPVLARSLCLLRLTHPAQECLRAHQAGLPVVALPAEMTHLALARVGFRVVVERVTAVEYALLQRMRDEGVAAGLAEVRAGVGEEGLQRWLQRQRVRGLLRGGTAPAPSVAYE